MKKLKYLLFILPFCFYFNVFALDKNVASYIQYDTDTPTGTYKGDEIDLGGYNGRFNIGTRYNGRLSLIEFYLDTDNFNFSTNHTYTITLNMATNDWRNNFMSPQVLKCNTDGSFQTTNYSLSVSNFRFISRKQIKFNFKTNSSLSPYLFFRLYSTDYASTNNVAITGDNNWNLSSIIISDNSSSGGSSGSTPTPTPTPSTSNQDIINNNNKNTDDIINNNNQNTTDIIDNANNNTQQIIDNQNSLLGSKCSNIFDFGNIYNYGSGASTISYNTTNLRFTGTSSNITGSNFVLYSLNLKSNTLYYFKLVNDYQVSILDSSYNTLYSSTSNSFTFNSSSHSNIYLAFYAPDDTTVTYSNVMVSTENVSFCVFGSYNSKLDEVGQSIVSGAQSILDNQNQNTQQQIDTQKVCNTYDKNVISRSNVFLNSSGYETSAPGWGITDFIKVNSNAEVKKTIQDTSGASICFYNVNKALISCNTYSTIALNTLLTIPQNTSYLRFSINTVYNRPQFSICKNGNQGIQDSITDSNIDSDVGNGFFDNFNNNMHGLSSIITIPLSSIEALSSSTCSPLHFPIPFTDNKYLDVPCMTEIYEQHVPTLLTLIQTCWYGILAYKVLVNIFGIVKGFKDPDSDKIEVMDL